MEAIKIRWGSSAPKSNRGSVAAAARTLGNTQRIIHYKIEKLKIDPENYR
jgi:transcriptional regulator with GAF, ATPase, and Fis domain